MTEYRCTLNNGTTMPLLGLGTYTITGNDVERVVRSAIEAGYRHFDTAKAYGNEREVGQALSAAIAAGDVTRSELYVVSKLWHDDHGTTAAARGFENSLRALGLDYLDNFLIHWPVARQGRYVETWETLVELTQGDELVSAGVSNFNDHHLTDIIDATSVAPTINQLELHPGFYQPEQLEANQQREIVPQAWSPLGRGIILHNPLLGQVAEEVEATPAQVAVRYLLDKGIAMVVKAANSARQVENLGALEIELSAQQRQQIDSLAQTPGFGRIFDDPEDFPG